MLRRVGELTGGAALELSEISVEWARIELTIDNLDVKLIENNAHIGAKVACEVAKLERELRNPHPSSSTYFPPVAPPVSSSSSIASRPTPQARSEQQALPTPSVLVFGAAAIDLTSSSAIPLSPRSTTPGTIFVSPGGVGRNIAEAAQGFLPPDSVQLVSVLGHEASSANPEEPDAFAKLLILELEKSGLRTDGLLMGHQEGASTAACSLMLDNNGDLVAGVADMGIVESLTDDSVRSIGSSPTSR